MKILKIYLETTGFYFKFAVDSPDKNAGNLADKYVAENIIPIGIYSPTEIIENIVSSHI